MRVNVVLIGLTGRPLLRSMRRFATRLDPVVDLAALPPRVV